MEKKDSSEIKGTIKQEQIHDLLFNREIGWQEMIYDLINSEQLDPWNIDISLLTNKYLEKIAELEEADFFVSSKVLLAAALLLRIKSEMLLDKYIKSIDEILFGKKEKKKYELERIELDEDVPTLVPKSPLPRLRRISLKELMDSLEKAIITENRRIKKEIIKKNALRDIEIRIPKKKYSIKEKIKAMHVKLTNSLQQKKSVPFSEFSGQTKEEKIATFSPLLHLETQKRVWLHQDKPLSEIHIWFKHVYLKEYGDPLKDLREMINKEIEGMKEHKKSKVTKKEKEKRIKKINEDFKNPLGDLFN